MTSFSDTSNSKQLSGDLQKKADRLAFLLVQSVMPQEQKEGWINLLPLMTEEQVDLLIEVLEQEHESYKASSEEFLQSLKKLEQSIQSKMQKLKAEERKVIDQFIHKKLTEYNQTS